MTVRIASILAGALLATTLGGGARADEEGKEKKEQKTGHIEERAPVAGMEMPAHVEAQKHITLVNVYLDGAMNNAKALSILAGLELAKKDATIVNEAKKNLNADLDAALKHIGHVKKVKEGTMDLGELERHVKEARDAAKGLKTVKLENLDTMLDPVETHLAAARTSFRDLAKNMKITVLEEIELGRAPVRGTEGSPGAPAPRPTPPPAQPETPPRGY